MQLKDYLKRKREIYGKKGHVLERLAHKSEGIYLGNYAKHDLDTIIYAYSFGFKGLYHKYLKRTISWLKQGIDKKEKLGEYNFHQYELTSSLAIADWISTGVNNVDLWKNTLQWQDMLYGNMDYSTKMGQEEKEIFALSILHYIQAQEYKGAIELYQSVKGNSSFRLSSNMSGYRVAYAYCLHFYEGKFTVEQLEKAARPFLEKHLSMLYTMGRSTEMLYWLKTICDVREKTYTPEEVIYTFYEYISEEDKPDFIKELLTEKSKSKKYLFSFLKW